MKFLKRYKTFNESLNTELKPLPLEDFNKLNGPSLTTYLKDRLDFIFGPAKEGKYHINKIQEYEYNKLNDKQKEYYILNAYRLPVYILKIAPKQLIEQYLDRRISEVLNIDKFSTMSRGELLTDEEFDNLNDGQIARYVQNLNGTVNLTESQLNLLGKNTNFGQRRTEMYLDKRIKALKALNKNSSHYNYYNIENYEFDKMTPEQVASYAGGDNFYKISAYQLKKLSSENITLSYLLNKFNGREAITEEQFKHLDDHRLRFYMDKRKEFIFNLKDEEETEPFEYTYFTDYELTKIKEVEFRKYIKTGFPMPENQLIKLNEQQLCTYFDNRFKVQYDGEHNEGSLNQKPITDYEYNIMSYMTNDKITKFIKCGALQEAGLQFQLTEYQLDAISKLSNKMQYKGLLKTYLKQRIRYVALPGYFEYYLSLEELTKLVEIKDDKFVNTELRNYTNALDKINTDNIGSYPSRWAKDYDLKDENFIKIGLMVDYISRTDNEKIIKWCYSFISSHNDAVAKLHFLKTHFKSSWDKLYEIEDKKSSLDSASQMGEMGF